MFKFYVQKNCCKEKCSWASVEKYRQAQELQWSIALRKKKALKKVVGEMFFSLLNDSREN